MEYAIVLQSEQYAHTTLYSTLIPDFLRERRRGDWHLLLIGLVHYRG